MHTWPEAASASVRRDTANQTCMHIWCAAIASEPWRAAIEVPSVIVIKTASVLPRRKPPVEAHYHKRFKSTTVTIPKLYLYPEIAGID